MSNYPTSVKVATITGGAVALLMAKYLVGHALTVMILAAVIAGIIAIVSEARVRKNAHNTSHVHTPTESTHPTVEHNTTPTPTYNLQALPQPQPHQTMHTQTFHHEYNPHTHN